VILAKVIFQEIYIRLKKGLQGIFSIVKGLSKMAFLHFKCMHSELASFAFSHANMQNGFSLFKQSKLSFEVISWCSGCLSGFIGVRISLEFPQLVC
jgi:hypothetical protein